MQGRRILQCVLTVASFAWIAHANAALILSVDDGLGHTVSVTDSDADGVVSYSGPIGAWTFNFSVGASKPALGDPYVDAMDLNSFNISGGAGDLTIRLTDTGFTRTEANWITQLGGTAWGTASFATYLNSTLISSFDTTAGAFSNTQSGSIDELAPYALTLEAKIHHDGWGVSSFDYLVKVPEPETISLFGAGLLGLAILRRRQMPRAS